MSSDSGGCVKVLEHPLIQHKLVRLRDRHTEPKLFRELVEEISYLMAYELTRDLATEEVEVETPLGVKAGGVVISGDVLAVVPILRAGLGMVDGIRKMVPMAPTGHIGLYRDPETLQPVEYYCKLPQDVASRLVVVVDPMLATGGSAVAAIDVLKRRGVSRIKFNCIIAAPEGLEKLHSAHPDVEVFTAAVDEKLDSHGYILPGLGDAGDRLFGTR